MPRKVRPPPPGLPVPTAAGRDYHVDGVKIPTVTGVLARTIPKGGLAVWGGRQSAEYVIQRWAALSALPPHSRVEAILGATTERQQRRRLDRELLQLAVECWATGQLPNETGLDKEIGQLWSSLLGWMTARGTDFAPLIWSRTIYEPHPDRRYAGHLDLVARIDGIVWLVMLKTDQVWPEDRLRLAATRYAPILLTADGDDSEQWPTVRACAVLQVKPGGTTLLPQTAGPRERGAFRAAYKLAQWSRANSKAMR